MENPGLKTLISFLDQVGRNEPVKFSTLCDERKRGYGMVSRYIRYCLKSELITIVSIRKTRGRYPSKEYSLSNKGNNLLGMFKETSVLAD